MNDERTRTPYGIAGHELIRLRLPLAEYRRLLAALAALPAPGARALAP